MRLIDADALIKQFEWLELCRLSKNEIYQIIHESPTIEPSLKLDNISNEERPQGEWIITAEDSEGIHRIQCPFCRYEKGSDFIDYITVTFEKLPPFCESCGAELKGGAE